ncbi:hypothetical protein ACT4UT_27820, partial [Bacillus sp. B-TM1]
AIENQAEFTQTAIQSLLLVLLGLGLGLGLASDLSKCCLLPCRFRSATIGLKLKLLGFSTNLYSRLSFESRLIALESSLFLLSGLGDSSSRFRSKSSLESTL